jgi:hypothetical protein
MIVRRNKYILIIVLIVFVISCTKRKHQSFSFVQLCDTQLAIEIVRMMKKNQLLKSISSTYKSDISLAS